MNKAVCIGVSVALVLDAAWFIRFAITKIVATFFRSDLKSILDESVVYSICSTQDLDFMWHMNNARYFRELDFARTDNLVRSGIYSTYRSIRSDIYVLQHASTIRYRRPINFLRPFLVRTKLIWWDSKSLYFEQRFETLHDGFIRAIAFSRNTVVNAEAEEVVRKCLENQKSDDNDIKKPELREDLKNWIEFDQSNSNFLKVERGVEL